MNAAVEAAVERAARAIAEHEGNERVFFAESESPVAKAGADAYRQAASIAVGTFVAALRDTGARA